MYFGVTALTAEISSHRCNRRCCESIYSDECNKNNNNNDDDDDDKNIVMMRNNSMLLFLKKNLLEKSETLINI